MLIFVFVDFSVFVVVVSFMLLCCQVRQSQKTTKTNNTQNKWKYFRVFFTRQVMVACAKVIVFFWLFCCFFFFFLVAQKHYKNRFFEDFDMFIFSYFGQICRVNNLATVRSITWPHFCKKKGKCGQVIDLTVFTWFLV